MKLQSLVQYCDEYLEAGKFKDFCPNGLQVEGSEEVSRIVTGVTASQALIDAAIEFKAHAILVHHGYFWKGESQAIVGLKGKRITKLIKNDISLLAYHLPLDAHPINGNNAQLAKVFNAQVKGSFYNYSGNDIGLYGDLEKALTIEAFSEKVSRNLKHQVKFLKGNDRTIKSIAWCSGGAQGGFEQAIELGVDAYISGEASENTFHLAQESGVHYIMAGHHATERGGPKALGEHLKNQFKLDVKFVDIYNPI